MQFLARDGAHSRWTDDMGARVGSTKYWQARAATTRAEADSTQDGAKKKALLAKADVYDLLAGYASRLPPT
jgi:hypothetical protein